MSHGGALATYVDLATTVAIYAFDKKERGQVSAKINMEYMNAAKIGSDVTIEARVNKIGKTLAFSEAKIFDTETKYEKFFFTFNLKIVK